MLDPFNHPLAQIRMRDPLALRGTAPLRALVCRHAEVSRVLLGKGIIGPEVAFVRCLPARRFFGGALSCSALMCSSTALRRLFSVIAA